MNEQQTVELETQLQKFYNGGFDNETRNNLEKSLYEKYKGMDNGLYFLSLQTYPYIKWFGVNLIQKSITFKNWVQLSKNSKQSYKQNIEKFLLSYYGKSETSIWKSLCGIIVKIGRIEYPNENPDYLQQLFQLCQKEDTMILGISMIKMTCEEFSSLSKTDLPQTVQDNLTMAFSSSAVKVLQFLMQLLGSLYSEHSKNPKFFQNERLYSVACLALECVKGLFTWIPSRDCLSKDILMIIIQYCLMNDSKIEVRNLAIDCVNEVLEFSFIASENQDSLLLIMNLIIQLLKNITEMNDISDLDDEFKTKFLFTLYQFVEYQFPLIEFKDNYPNTTFLTLLYQYTVQLKEPEDFSSVLEVWSNFLGYQTGEKTTKELEFAQNKYREAIVILAAQVFKRTQISSMGFNYFSTIDDTKQDQKGETEFDHYLSFCLNLLSSIADFLPKETIQIIDERSSNIIKMFQSSSYENLNKSIGSMNDKERNDFIVCRDLTVIVRIYSGLSEIFFSGISDVKPPLELIQLFVELSKFSMNQKLYLRGNLYQNLITECYTTLQMFVVWMSNSNNFENENFKKLIESITESTILTVTSPDVPQKISIAAQNLFFKICYSIKLPFILDLKAFQLLYQNIHQMKNSNSYDSQIISKIYLSIHHTLLIRKDQQINMKYIEFVKGVSSPYMKILQDSNFISSKGYLNNSTNQILVKELQILSSFILDVENDPVQIKQVVYESTKDVISTILEMFKIYINNPDMLDSLFNFLSSIFKSLKSQVGIEFVEKTVQTFIEVFTTETLNKIMNSISGKKIVISFLNLLLSLSMEGSQKFYTLIPSIIGISKEVIYPLILQLKNESIDIQEIYYDMLFNLITFRWRYFFAQNNEPNTQETLAHFNFIMDCYLNSFKSEEIVILRKNLSYFERLKNMKDFYKKPAFFNGNLCFNFLKVFFQMIQKKTLVKQEVLETIYDIISTNSMILEKFIVMYLSEFNLNDNQKSDLCKIFKKSSFESPAEMQYYIDSFLDQLNFYFQ
eukprot:gene8231-56_t